MADTEVYRNVDHPLVRTDFDTAVVVLQETTAWDVDRVRTGRVWLLSADERRATEWGNRYRLDEACRERDRLVAWARPAAADLDALAASLTPAARRIVSEDFLEPRRGRDNTPAHMLRMHMQPVWNTERVLRRHGLSDGHRLTDLGWYLRLYLRATHGLTRPSETPETDRG